MMRCQVIFSFDILLQFGAEGQNFNRLGRSNAPKAHKLPTRGFSDLNSENPNFVYF